MTAELYSFDAWRSKGQRKRPTPEQVRAGHLKLAFDQWQRAWDSAAYWEEEVARLDERLEANVTLRGKNKGKPLSGIRRSQLQAERDRGQRQLNDDRESCADLKQHIVELEGRA